MDTSQHLTDLRRKAEEQLAVAMSSLPEKSPEDMQALVHDLHVHQIELTLQNEELRRIQTELEVSRAQYADLYSKYANLYEFAPVGYCTLDESGAILEMNLTAAKQLGIQRDTALRARIYQYIVEGDRDTFFAFLRAAFSTGLRQTCELRLLKQDGTCFWAQLEGIVAQVGSKVGSEVRSERLSALPQDAEASTNYCLIAITDITDRKHAEEQLKISFREKDILMQEILHRTKNNMSAIISLLYLFTARHPENTQVASFFQEIEQRILAMLLIQQKLYQSGNYTSVDLKEYFEELTPEVVHSLQVSTVRLHLTTESVVVSPDTAITCGLLLNELLTNTLKYAFPPDGSADRIDEPGQSPGVPSGNGPGEIHVALRRIDAETVELRVSDNGVGLPEDFDIEHPKSLGLSLIDGFVQQLHGTFEFTSDHGTQWCIRFPQRP